MRFIILFESSREVSNMTVRVPQDIEPENQHVKLLHQLCPVVVGGLLHQRRRRDRSISELQGHPKYKAWTDRGSEELPGLSQPGAA
ncbi:hypothetical protein HW555_001717 [Spodoptera exigua]|uniref:Uncharacterized protein n=1 Tax=Spodoptera exigua TaxID=7107 RepID=A0A835LF48_SPOEX|nr:hypothetical protein HW555_001717 [Spodoptera exigua]